MNDITLRHLVSIMKRASAYGQSSGSIKGWIINKVSYVKPGTIFFLERKKFNTETVDKAFELGAKAVIVDQPMSLPSKWNNRCLIKVPNTTVGIMQFMRYYRNRFPIPVIGITGSVGKSTTTEMTAAILASRWKIVKTINNGNLSRYFFGYLSKLNSKHQAAVFEMGMNRFGEIAGQCYMACPTIGVITKIGEAHVGNLRSNVNNVVKAKQELIDGLNPKGLLILNLDDSNTKKLNTKNFKGTIKYFSITQKNTDFWATDIETVRDGTKFKAHFEKQKYEFFIPVFGKHNVGNALAAIAVANHLGFSVNCIKNGLATFQPPKARLQLVRGIRGSLIINDSYNANPTSMCAGLEVLKQLAIKDQKKSIAVLGSMAELGATSREGHQRVGNHVAKHNIDYLYTIGLQAKQIAAAAKKAGMPKEQIKTFSTSQNSLPVLRNKLDKNTLVLFKGSRVMALDKLIKQLKLQKQRKKK